MGRISFQNLFIIIANIYQHIQMSIIKIKNANKKCEFHPENKIAKFNLHKSNFFDNGFESALLIAFIRMIRKVEILLNESNFRFNKY